VARSSYHGFTSEFSIAADLTLGYKSKLSASLLDDIPQSPKRLLADFAYDTPGLRSYLSERDYKLMTTAYWGARKNKPPLAPKMKRAKRRWWVTEGTFGWLKSLPGIARVCPLDTCRWRRLSTYWVALAFGVATLDGRRIDL
jgi:hypothetical protein